MSIAANTPHLTRSALLGNKETQSDAYDEVFDQNDQPRELWQPLFDYLSSQSAGDNNFLRNLQGLNRRLQRHQELHQLPISRPETDAGPDTSGSSLDAVPFLLGNTDWQSLSQGLVQRAKLLDLLVGDFYGKQKLLRGGHLPTALAFANSQYLLPAVGTRSDTDVNQPALDLIAFDLARSPEGQWWVVGQEAETPTGLGQTLANRMAMASCQPDLLDSLGVTRLAGFFSRYSQRVQAANPTDQLTVILGSGQVSAPHNQQSLLSRYLGFPLVEGGDLVVRDSGVFLRTLEGLKAVGSILRHLSSDDCDPMELRNRSLLGVPGLLECVRRGQVRVSNPLGSGVVDNQACFSFLPGLCRHLLKEELSLPSLATWWCGQDYELEHVLGHLNQLELADAFAKSSATDGAATGDVGATLNPHLLHDTTAAIGPSTEALANKVRQQPYSYLGREMLLDSEMLYLNQGHELATGTMRLRLYVAKGVNGYETLPGGIATLKGPDGPRSKDVWVIGGRAPQPGTRLASSEPFVRRSDRNLSSRHAESLYWFGRYLERAESAARTLRTGLQSDDADLGANEWSLHLPEEPSDQLLRSILPPGPATDAATQEQLPLATHTDRLLRYPLWATWRQQLSQANPDGLVGSLTGLQRNAQALSSRLSPDVTRLLIELSTLLPTASEPSADAMAQALQALDEILDKLSSVNGHLAENMTRGYGWRFAELGKRIERTDYTLRVISELATTHPAGPATADRGTDPDSLNLILHLCDCVITHRARYQSAPNLASLLDLLILDGSNPRSTMHQFNIMQQHLRILPLDRNDSGVSEADRLVLAAQNELTLANLDKLAGQISSKGVRTTLVRLLSRMKQANQSLAQFISATYFEQSPPKLS